MGLPVRGLGAQEKAKVDLDALPRGKITKKATSENIAKRRYSHPLNMASHGLTHFGFRLYEEIRAMNWTVADFAQAAGDSTSSVYAMAIGAMKPRLHEVTTWAKVLRIEERGGEPELLTFYIEAVLAHTPPNTAFLIREELDHVIRTGDHERWLRMLRRIVVDVHEA